MIVAAFIFSMVMTAAVGATLSIVAANQQAEAVKSVISNFNYALESMVRNLRIGTDYACGTPRDSFGNCSVWAGSGAGSESMTYIDYRGRAVGYRKSGTAIQVKSGSTWLDITSPEVKIDTLTFYVDGRGRGSDQPNVLIVVVGHVDFRDKTTRFSIETMATQRKVDPDETT